MSYFGAQMAAGIGTAAVNNIFGMMAADYNYANQRELTELDRRLNYEYNEKAAAAADWRTRQLYKDLYSPEALMKQYKDAGLSPSLMFGGTPGQGGISGAQGAGASGPQTGYTPFMPTSMVEAAQVAEMMAQARKTNAEASTITGENERGSAEIAGLLLKNGNIEAATAYLNAQRKGQEITNLINEGTQEEQMDFIRNNAEKMKEEANQAYWEAAKSEQDWQMREETWNAEAQTIVNNCNKLFYDYLNSEKNLEVSEKQIEKIGAEISQITNKIAQDWHNLKLKKASIEAQKKFWNETARNQGRQIEAKYTEIWANGSKPTPKSGEKSFEEKTMDYLEGALLLLTLKGGGGKAAKAAATGRTAAPTYDY